VVTHVHHHRPEFEKTYSWGRQASDFRWIMVIRPLVRLQTRRKYLLQGIKVGEIRILLEATTPGFAQHSQIRLKVSVIQI
jgi:hypothetical protein